MDLDAFPELRFGRLSPVEAINMLPDVPHFVINVPVFVNFCMRLLTYRTNSSHMFTVGVVDYNIYNIKGGTGNGYADGWFLFIKPLAPGEHKIHLVGSIDAPDPNCNNSADVTWVIRVK